MRDSYSYIANKAQRLCDCTAVAGSEWLESALFKQRWQVFPASYRLRLAKEPREIRFCESLPQNDPNRTLPEPYNAPNRAWQCLALQQPPICVRLCV